MAQTKKDPEKVRKEFAQGHRELWAAVKKTGAQPYNLLHHADRDELIDTVQEALDKLKASAAAFKVDAPAPAE